MRDPPRLARRTVLLGAAALIVAAGGLAAILAARSGSSPTETRTTAVAPVRRTVAARTRPAPLHVAVTAGGRLPAPLQDAAAAPLGTGALVIGGLTAADTSSDTVQRVSGGSVAAAGRLPGALHDAAAVTVGGRVLLLGGGNGVSQTDAILRVDPRTGRAVAVGHLPAPASDLAATVVGDTAYAVGGYTGSRWLDTVTAVTPAGSTRVVAHLPQALRYAAVAAAGGRIVVAGGSIPSGMATAAVEIVDPRTGRVRQGAPLPTPTTHAAGATLGGEALVIGGRGSSAGTSTDRIVAIDPRTGRGLIAGRLPAAASDATAVTLPAGVLVIGGRGPMGTVATLTRIRQAAGAASAARITRPPSVTQNVYSADSIGNLAPATRGIRTRIYVPNSQSDTVDEIDPRTYRVVRHFTVGGLPQHVVPSWDLRTLYVTNDTGNSLTALSPRTGRVIRTIPVDDPYNMYFTPSGRFAIVVAEAHARLDFRDAHTFRLHRSVPVPCRGVDHMDFTADGRFALVSCEFSGDLLRLDVARETVDAVIPLGAGSMPQDVKLSPDGRVFYVAEMMRGGLAEVDPRTWRQVGFLPTGAGTHGLYPSRDARFLYVSNRSGGTVSVVSFRTRRVVRTWTIPHGSPDMGGVSADGRTLWLTGRYGAEVYAIDTRTGRLRARIPVGAGPHGLCVWPQPGRYSLGHTGILR